MFLTSFQFETEVETKRLARLAEDPVRKVEGSGCFDSRRREKYLDRTKLVRSSNELLSSKVIIFFLRI
jgi:hypothetical protein